MTATQRACCGTCEHWAPNYAPTRLELEDAPNGTLPVVKHPEWGWCLKKVPGEWMGWKQHKQSIPNVGVETHYEGGCEGHEDRKSFEPSPPSASCD